MNKILLEKLVRQATDNILGVDVLDKELLVRLVVEECCQISDLYSDSKTVSWYIRSQFYESRN